MKTQLKPFQYQIPAQGMKPEKRANRYTVKAWLTECPGLIIQCAIESEDSFALVHRNSGFMARTYEDFERYLEIAKNLNAWGKIDWTVATGKEIIEQTAKLSKEDASQFMKILTRTGIRDYRAFRANLLQRLKSWDAWVNGQ